MATSIVDTRAEFNRRMLGWARAEFHREIEAGFPLVRGVASSQSRWLVSVLGRRPPEDQARLVALLTKRFWGGPGRGGELTPDERAFVDAALSEILTCATSGPPPGPKVERRVLRREVQDALAPLLGSIDTAASNARAGLMWYRTTLAGWTVDTQVDVGGRDALKYSHVVRTARGGMLTMVSLMAWLGLSSETTWDEITHGDAGAAAAALARACDHFFRHAPSLLEGLAPPGVSSSW
jgi:hypothetical protein